MKKLARSSWEGLLGFFYSSSFTLQMKYVRHIQDDCRNVIKDIIQINPKSQILTFLTAKCFQKCIYHKFNIKEIITQKLAEKNEPNCDFEKNDYYFGTYKCLFVQFLLFYDHRI